MIRGGPTDYLQIRFKTCLTEKHLIFSPSRYTECAHKARVYSCVFIEFVLKS